MNGSLRGGVAGLDCAAASPGTKEERMLPQPNAPRNDDRIVLYRGIAYRRLADGRVVIAPSAGRRETLAASAVPPPVLRALGLAARAGVWRPEAA